MTEHLTLTTERVDDIPLLLAQLERMGLKPCWTSILPPTGTGSASAWAG